MPASSEGELVTQTAVLPAGVALHARPAAELVRAAARLPVAVTVAANGKRASAKSILEILALGATGGTELTLSASGPDAAEAVAALAQLVAGLRA
jgi:phosphotransferase system HPr (HPr) family protein